jgi:hypothetical protein
MSDLMPVHQPDSNPVMAGLAALVGEWTQQVDVTGEPFRPGRAASAVQ